MHSHGKTSRPAGRKGFLWPRLRIALIASACALLMGQARAGEPRDLDIHSEEGDVIHVHFEAIVTPGNDDRCDIAFAAASSVTGPRLMVVNNARTLRVDDKDRGPKVMTFQSGHDYDSYDLGRNYQVKEGLRGNAFGRQAVSPKQQGIQIAFYRAATQEQENRLTLRITPPLAVIPAPAPGVRLIIFPLPPGYKTTFLWTATGHATRQPVPVAPLADDSGDNQPARARLLPSPIKAGADDQTHAEDVLPLQPRRTAAAPPEAEPKAPR